MVRLGSWVLGLGGGGREVGCCVVIWMFVLAVVRCLDVFGVLRGWWVVSGLVLGSVVVMDGWMDEWFWGRLGFGFGWFGLDVWIRFWDWDLYASLMISIAASLGIRLDWRWEVWGEVGVEIWGLGFG